MGDLIDVEPGRWQKAGIGQALKGANADDIRTLKAVNAFAVFDECSSYGASRQLKLLYEILNRYRVQEPIGLDEMTDLMIEYLQRNEKYLSKKLRRSMKFDFEKEFRMCDIMRLLGLRRVVGKRPQP